MRVLCLKLFQDKKLKNISQPLNCVISTGTHPFLSLKVLFSILQINYKLFVKFFKIKFRLGWRRALLFRPIVVTQFLIVTSFQVLKLILAGIVTCSSLDPNGVEPSLPCFPLWVLTRSLPLADRPILQFLKSRIEKNFLIKA